MTEAEESEFGIIYFTKEVGGLTQEEMECVRRADAIDSVWGALDYRGDAGHQVLDCVRPEQLAERDVANFFGFVASFFEGNVPFETTDDQWACVHAHFTEMHVALRKVPEGTEMSSVRGFFTAVAMFSCHTDEQLNVIYEDAATETEIDCGREVFEIGLRDYRQLGPRLTLGNPEALTPEELESREAHEARIEAVESRCSDQ